MARCLSVCLPVCLQARVRDPTGATPLHECAKSGSRECAKLLLDQEADINEVDDNQATPMHLVGNPGEVHLLSCISLCAAGGPGEMYRRTPFLRRTSPTSVHTPACFAGLKQRLLRDGAAVC